MHYFEATVAKYQDDLSVSLMEKRTEFHNDDPLEELSEVFSEVREIESNFKKLLEICGKF